MQKNILIKWYQINNSCQGFRLVFNWFSVYMSICVCICILLWRSFSSYIIHTINKTWIAFVYSLLIICDRRECTCRIRRNFDVKRLMFILRFQEPIDTLFSRHNIPSKFRTHTCIYLRKSRLLLVILRRGIGAEQRENLRLWSIIVPRRIIN